MLWPHIFIDPWSSGIILKSIKNKFKEKEYFSCCLPPICWFLYLPRWFVIFQLFCVICKGNVWLKKIFLKSQGMQGRHMEHQSSSFSIAYPCQYAKTLTTTQPRFPHSVTSIPPLPKANSSSQSEVIFSIHIVICWWITNSNTLTLMNWKWSN